MTKATSEQSNAAASLVRSADEVRRIARQTARALEEQTDAIGTANAGVLKQTSMAASVARATAEQAATTSEIARATSDMRQRIREAVAATTSQSKRAATVAADANEVAAKIAQIAKANIQQVTLLTALSTAVGDAGLRNEEPA